MPRIGEPGGKGTEMAMGWLGRGPRVYRAAAGGDRDGGRTTGIVDDLERMIETLERERERVVRTGASCCLAIVAIDRLDGAVADQVMHDIGDRLLDNLRPYDDVYRYGQDRYLVSLPHIKTADVPSVMGRLRDLVADEPAPLKDGRDLAVTASLGCAMMDGEVSLRGVLDRADQALRAAVSDGGDCFRVWAQGL